MYWFKNLNVTLESSEIYDSYSYIEILIYPCIGDSCASKQLINFILERNNFMFIMQDSYLTPQFYKSPLQLKKRSIITPIYSNLFEETYLKFQEIIIETDEDIYGIGLSNIKKEKLLKYENALTYSSPIKNDIYNSNRPIPIASIALEISENSFIIQRSSTTLIEVLAKIGGITKILFTGFDLVLSIIINRLYEKSIVNNLFEFDLDKKLIIIKTKKNNIPKLDNSKITNFVNHKLINKQNNDDKIKKKNESSLSRNNLIDDNFSPKTKTDANFGLNERKVRIYNINLKKKIKVNNMTNQIEKNENIDKNGTTEITNVNENKNKNTTNKIKINKCLQYLCFLCLKKRNNMENVLLDKAMHIIMENLDILNLFRKIFREEEEQIFKKKKIQIPEFCKIKIDRIIK